MEEDGDGEGVREDEVHLLDGVRGRRRRDAAEEDVTVDPVAHPDVDGDDDVQDGQRKGEHRADDDGLREDADAEGQDAGAGARVELVHLLLRLHAPCETPP